MKFAEALGVFQFTPLREGRRGWSRRSRTNKNISIHAPPRGATGHLSADLQRAGNFNSRPSARGDDNRKQQQRWLYISIHAPPRGATFFHKGFHFLAVISIHAPPRGATAGYPARTAQVMIFQFTPLREGRLEFLRLGSSQRYFNSRPSARGDMVSRTRQCGYGISIHAPPRGATRKIDNVNSGLCISIHAPPRGATIIQAAMRHFYNISIHAPPRGATQYQNVSVDTFVISIHAPPRGATYARDVIVRPQTYFNSRPSARGDDAKADIDKLLKEFQFTPLREGRQPTGTL